MHENGEAAPRAKGSPSENRRKGAGIGIVLLPTNPDPARLAGFL